MTVPTRHVDNRSPASGRRPSEMIKAPDWAWWVYWSVRWCWRYPRTAGTVWLTLVVWVWSGWLWLAVVVAGLTWVAFVCLWLLGLRRSLAAPGGTLATLAVGLAHMITLRRAWPDICRTAHITAPRGTELPRLRAMTITPDGGVQADVRLGGAVETLEQNDRLADTVGCREVTVTRLKPGWARIQAAWGDRLAATVHLHQLPKAPAGRITYGLTATGRPATLRYSESVLIGGTTGSGKSVCTWALLAGLRREHIPTRLYVSDAKGGIELKALGDQLGADTGTVRVHQYATSPDAGEAMVKTALAAMHARLADMGRRGDRKHVPTPDEPLVVVVIDELLPLQDQLAKGTKSELGRLLYMGRAAGYVVWAGTQDATVESLGRARDLIPQRICFATRNRHMAEAVLGPEPPPAWKIRTAGVGYSESDGEYGHTRFRSAAVSDVEAGQIAAGTLSPAGPDTGRTALYRWYGTGPDTEPAETRGNERPLYVGVSYDAVGRFAQHQAAGRDWTRRVGRVTVEYFDTRDLALAAEKAEIQTGAWEANVAGAGVRRRRKVGAA